MHEKFIDRAKNNMVESVDLSFEDSFVAAQFFADREAFGLPLMTPSRLKERIAAVTYDDVRAVASFVLRPERFYLVGVGPIRSVKRLSRISEIVRNTFS